MVKKEREFAAAVLLGHSSFELSFISYTFALTFFEPPSPFVLFVSLVAAMVELVLSNF